MVIVIPTVTSDETHKHLPPATDLPLALVFIAIYVLGLTFYVIYWLGRSYRHRRRDAVAAGYGTMSSDDRSELISDDSSEPVMLDLDQVAPARTYKQWKAETNDAANIASGFDAWWARESNTTSTPFSDYFSVQFVWSQCWTRT
ncbi:hypothetical protein B0T10DRAFT_417944 [Thelonectria olida]|uniref:Uncharacterized protein n=1 Tax=Thelonectria olida TaxID=1576542 RepID=A0A9P9AI45_9HYPO|nr:hypothetical protein B0T10DRAFT_417944 [Thelonectria olida]